MTDPLDELEGELRQMRPRAPTEGLRRGIAAELDAPQPAASRAHAARPTSLALWTVLAVGACLLVAFGGWIAWRAGQGPSVAGPKPAPPKPPRAPMALAAGCRVEPWGEARYEVLGPRRVRLTRGELLVQVEPGASGRALVVETPAGEAVVRAKGDKSDSPRGGELDSSPFSTQFLVETRPLHSTPVSFAESPAPKENRDMIQAKRVPAHLTRVLVLAGVVQLLNPLGSATGGPGELLGAETAAAPRKHVEDLAGKFGQFYKPVAADVKPSIPAYALPVETAKVANWDKVVQALKLDAAAEKLTRNGFVVVSGSALQGVPRNDIVRPYSRLKTLEIPIFVTSDTLLHLYHVQFDESLLDIEQREFYPDMVAMSAMLAEELGGAYAKAGDALQRQALAKAWVLAAVGRKCLQPDWQPAGPLARFVTEVMEKIDKHEGFWPPRNSAYQDWPVFRYSEDFSQYVPRGHYTRSEELKRYFLAMMWFGRMTFLLKGEEPYGPADQPALVPPAEARAQTMAAAHLTRLLAEGKLADGRPARQVWERIYTVTAFYVGLADDLGVPEYEASLRKVLGASMNVAGLADPAKFRQLQVELAKFGAPAIYGGTGDVITFRGEDPGALVAALDKTTGFRLMGQRFIPDSYVMGKLVFPTVGAPRGGRSDAFTCVQSPWGPVRGFPRGLDVAAWLGSHRARHWLAELGDDAYGEERDLAKGKDLRYDAVLEGLRAEFDALSPAQWNRNAYWSWLYALRALLVPYGEGYQTFMTTPAWQDKSMNTVLASWAQLRHDTILYAKQSYTMAAGSAFMPKPVEGYVEPVPEFYARLLATTRMTLAGLKELEALQPQAAERLEKLAELIEQLLAISRKELANQELTKEEYDFIRNVGSRLQRIEVSDPELMKAAQEASAKRDEATARKLWAEIQQRSGHNPMETAMVADVHTDSNSQEVLEEATGQVDLAVVCYLQPDGRLVLGVGPVLSYYEFRHPMRDRLTDEAWIKMLREGKAPGQPKWTETYRAE